MMRRTKYSVRIVAAGVVLAILLVGAVVVRATQGGATSDSLTYAGTLSGVAAGPQTFSFVLHKGASNCAVSKAADVGASGAFAVTFSAADSSCLAGFFDGSDVTVDVSVAGVSITGQPITPVPYAKYADTAANYAPNSPIAQIVPTGAVIAYAGDVPPSPPPGWLLCDGTAVSRTTYAALFAVVGTSAGAGDASTTFNLPDYRGRFLRGLDHGSGIDPDAASRTAMNSGGNTGNKIGTVQPDAFASHIHGNPGSAWSLAASSPGAEVLYGVNGGSGANSNTSAAGGNETRPKNATVNYLIKY